MSRGLGTMQRAILQVYDQAVPVPQGRAPGAWRYGLEDILPYAQAWWGVVDLYGLRCTPTTRTAACFACFMDVRYPHVRRLSAGLGNSLEVSFSRALRSLVRRGHLVCVTEDGVPVRGVPRRIEAVVRP
jgi:hypothetical protein